MSWRESVGLTLAQRIVLVVALAAALRVVGALPAEPFDVSVVGPPASSSFSTVGTPVN
ncbi:MAG: hypothetical protein ABIV94_07385 [Acidimicrobiales bacterium]